MIRVLHLVSSLSKGSGVMSMIMNYYRNINRDNVQFDFCYFVESDISYSDEIKYMGGKVFKLDKPSLSKKCIKNLNQFFQENTNKYLALHIHEVYLTFLFGPIARKNGVNNIITHSHNTSYSDKFLNSIRNRILCLPLKKISNHYFACSKAAGENLYGLSSVNDGKVSIINNAIDCEKFRFNESKRDEVRNSLNIDNKFVVGHVGRFSKQKNHIFLVDIFAEIKKKNPESVLVLVGDGPLLENAKRRVEELKLRKSVLFLGSREDIPSLLSSFDIFILPSFFEGLPVVCVEAQASGLPVIMSDNITQEIGLFNYQYISLKESPNYWADQILKVKSEDRNFTYKKLRNKGFDILGEAKKLESRYLSMKNK